MNKLMNILLVILMACVILFIITACIAIYTTVMKLM